MIRGIFFALVIALSGGLIARKFRISPVVGYIFSGVIFSSFFSIENLGVNRLAELGSVFLLFSVGLELSLSKLSKIFKIAIFGGIIQITVTLIAFFGLLTLLNFSTIPALIIAFSFSLSSTALVVKILADRGELDSIHGQLMIGWLLLQDIAVIPVMVMLSAIPSGGNILTTSLLALIKAIFIILIIVFLGRLIIPYLLHKVASVNSRELLVLSSVLIALGTAFFTSIFGISYALGAFLAGIVISETQENHAVFAETRPLRDLFVALFFVSFGLLIEINLIISNFFLILFLVVFVLIIKFLVFLSLSIIFGYHGKTAVRASLGLSQVGEFAFFTLSQALLLGVIASSDFSIGVSVAVITLLFTPFLFRSSMGVWRKMRALIGKWPRANKIFIGKDKKHGSDFVEIENHVVICGYGRVGKWIAKALDSLEIKFIVVDYNQQVLKRAEKEGMKVLYGDPSETGVLESLNIGKAKVVVIAIPDRFVQEELITKVQTISPKVKIISRAHFDEDYDRFKFLRVDKIVQPEFEASIAITRSILSTLGKPKDVIVKKIRGLRQSKALS